MRRRTPLVPAALLAVGLAVPACRDDEEDVFDIDVLAAQDECEDACADWEACTGVAFDVDACVDRCLDAVAANALTSDDVDACEDCLDTANERCVEECAAVCAAADIPLPPR